MKFTAQNTVKVNRISGTRTRAYHKCKITNRATADLCGLESLTCGAQHVEGDELEYMLKQGMWHPVEEGKTKFGAFVATADKDSGLRWIPNQEYSPTYAFDNLELDGAQWAISASDYREYGGFADDKYSERKATVEQFKKDVIAPLNLMAKTANPELVAESIKVFQGENQLVCIFKGVAKKRKRKEQDVTEIVNS